jgi:hypothetical protein
VEREAETRFADAVEAVRVGYITARDRKAWNRWRNRRRKAVTGTDGQGLTGAALEAAILRVGQMFPGSVIREQAAG